MKIAICDDDYGICEELSKWLRKADNDSRKQMIEVFQEAEKLLTSIQNGAVYDLLYLDVELPDINGVEVGARLKDMEIPGNIIFVSGKDTYCKDMFDLRPFNFYQKPLNREKVIKDYHLIKEKEEEKGRCRFWYKKDGCTSCVYIQDIKYVEAFRGGVKIYTTNGEYIELRRRSIQNFAEEYSQQGMVRIHRSYVINIDAVTSIRGNQVQIDGQDLSIGREYVKELRKKYAKQYHEHLLEKPCRFEAECRGTCSVCENIAMNLWHKTKKPNAAYGKKIYAPVRGIERLRIQTDGKGVRTLIALNHCMLNCRYCINKQHINVFPFYKKVSVEQLGSMIEKMQFISKCQWRGHIWRRRTAIVC